MAFIPAVNGIQLCFQFVLASQNVEFCLSLRKSAGAVTPVDLADAAALGESWWNSDLGSLTSPAATLSQVVATDMSVQGGQQAIEPVGTAGSQGTVPEANNVSIVVSQRTALRGRSYRGRAYLVGIPSEVRLNPTDITTAAASARATAFSNLAVDLDGGGFDVVVASRSHNKAVTNPADQNEVIAYVVDNHFDSQRRRLFGRGT